MDKSIAPINQIAVRSSTCYEFSNPNEAVVVEIEDEDTSVGTVEKQIKYLKLNHQFNEKDVPPVFQSLIEVKMNSLKRIHLHIHGQFYTMNFDETEIRLEKCENGWSITCERKKETIRCDDPEKSIVDHLWFVLRNPNIKLEVLQIIGGYKDRKAEHLEKLDALLQSMSDTFDHQIQTRSFFIAGFNEDTFFSLLKHVKPRTLENVHFAISWKEKENYRKLEEIVETEQWKQAKRISSCGVTPFKIDDFLQYESFSLKLDNVTPNDVLRTSEHVLNSAGNDKCMLSCEKLDIDAIMNVFRSQNDVARVTRINLFRPIDTFSYEIVKSGKCLELRCSEKIITIHKA